MFSVTSSQLSVGTPPAHLSGGGETMLRADMQDSEQAVLLRLEGRFTGEDAEYVRMLVTRCNTERGLVLDGTQVTFIDSVGEATPMPDLATSLAMT